MGSADLAVVITLGSAVTLIRFAFRAGVQVFAELVPASSRAAATMSLCELIASGQLDEATRVAKKKKSYVNKLDGNGVAPLRVALRSGYEEFARFLVEKCKADAA